MGSSTGFVRHETKKMTAFFKCPEGLEAGRSFPLTLIVRATILALRYLIAKALRSPWRSIKFSKVCRFALPLCCRLSGADASWALLPMERWIDARRKVSSTNSHNST